MKQTQQLPYGGYYKRFNPWGQGGGTALKHILQRSNIRGVVGAIGHKIIIHDFDP
jgi:hypothetical protein